MIDKKFIRDLRQDYSNQESQRRQIIKAANEILFLAKKSIFALQREDIKSAKTQLSIMTEQLKELEKKFGAKRLQQEGAYQAAAEEYIEALTLAAIINNKTIKAVTQLELHHNSYLAGLCDLIGELVRYATNQAAKGNYKAVPKIKEQAEKIMAELLNFDFTGYLRTKYDQANGHLRKLEQITYELKLRKK